MQKSFNVTAERASNQAVTAVEMLIQQLALRLSMLRNTIAAFTLAAYERPEDLGKLHLPSMLEALTTLLPSDEAFAEQLSPVAAAFLASLSQAAEAERQRAVSPDLLVRLIEACSGGDVAMKELEALGSTLHDSIAVDIGYGHALSAFYSALHRQGIQTTATAKSGQTPSVKFERIRSERQPKAPARKRDKLTAGAV